MRRHLSLVILFLGLVVLLVGSPPPVRGQDATPVPTVIGEVTVEETRFGLAEIMPAAPATIIHYRLEMPPGTRLAFDPEPGLGAHLVEAGTLTISLVEDVTLTRNGRPGELLPGGEEAALEPGDGFMWTPDIAGEFRNDGTERVVLLVVTIFPEAGLPDAHAAFATPAP